MNARGFTLLEVLIACLLVLGVTAAVAAMAVPMRHAFERTINSAELSSGSRAALERLIFDVREAGSDASVGVPSLGLADVAAVAVPLASLADQRIQSPGQAIKLARINLGAAQGVLRQRVAAGAATLQLETAARCMAVGMACGFEAGMTAILFDTARSVIVTVRAVGAGGVLQTSAALTSPFDPGAIVAAAAITTYGLRDESDGSRRLVRISPGGAEQPVIQSVVDFEVVFRGAAIGPQLVDADKPSPTYGPHVPLAYEDDPRDVWGAGENCTIGRDADARPVSRLAVIGPPTELTTLTTSVLTDGPWCPDHVDGSRFDADLLRTRAVELRLRVETSSALFRGPAGRLFRRAGTQPHAARWVPDVEVRLTVGTRNIGHE
jgi:hypothetical protein